MSHTIQQLKALSDEELIAAHDSIAINTVVGINYYLEEIRRRDADRAEAAAYDLSKSAYRLAVVNGWLAGVSAVAAIAAIIIAVVT